MTTCDTSAADVKIISTIVDSSHLVAFSDSLHNVNGNSTEIIDNDVHNRSSDGSSDSPRGERSGSVSDSQRRRKRRRIKGGEHHRRWRQSVGEKSLEEKKIQDDRHDRNGKVRQDRFRRGKPMAPFNTNQYLMEQHEPSDVALSLDLATTGIGAERGERWGSLDSDDDYYYDNIIDDEAEENFIAKEFAETYQTYHAERLQTMTKEDLVREFIALETKVEQLESLVKKSSKKSRIEKKLEAEIERLAKENAKLTAELDSVRKKS